MASPFERHRLALEARKRNARARIKNRLHMAAQDGKRLLDPTLWVRSYPIASTAGVFAAGLGAARFFQARRSGDANGNGAADGEHGGRSERGAPKDGALKRLVVAALATAGALVRTQAVQSFVEGLAKKDERAATPPP